MSGSKRPKVLYVLDKSGFGGVQTIAYSLMKRPVPDVDMVFFFLRNINRRFNMADIDEERVIYSRASSRYSLLPLLETLRLLRSGNFDVLHLNGNKAIILGVILKLIFRNLTIIAHDHGGVFDYKKWYGSFLRYSRNIIDTYLCVSERRKKFLQGECSVPGSKIRIINNFVDDDRISLALNRSGATCPEVKKIFTIGYLGGLSHIKGCDVLIRAVPMLLPHLENFRVIVAGDGPARMELETLVASLEVNSFVTFLGYAGDPAKVYTEFDLMVIPSRSEEGPICLYEAWMMRIPVIASNAPVLNERILDYETGLFFESEDSASLAGKIIELYRDSQLRSHLIEKSYTDIDRYSFNNYLDSLKEIYLSAV